jgi:hypothetical protein
VTTVYDRGDPRKDTTTKTYNDYVRAVGVKRRTIEVGAAINLGREITLVCVAVNGHVSRAGSVSLGTGAENDASVALKLRYGGFDYFIGGDLTGGGRSGSKRTADVEGLVAAVVGDVDVLKVSHHGSTTSSNPTFLATLKPEVAIISVGTGGSNKSRYHHPSREVLDRLLILPGLQAIFMTTRGETVGGLKPRDLRVIRIAGEDVTLSTDGLTYMVNGQVFPVDERPARPR